MGYDSRNIRDVRFGSIQAKALYLGNVLIWPLGPAPIPTTYTRLEYLRVDETAYLDVGVPVYQEGMTDPHEFYTFAYDIDVAPEAPTIISTTGADMYCGINGYCTAGSIFGVQNLDKPGQEIWVWPYPENMSVRCHIGRKTTMGVDQQYVGDEANRIHSNTVGYIDGVAYPSYVSMDPRYDEPAPIDPTDPDYMDDPDHAPSDGVPYRWTLSTQDPVHDPNENMPGRYYEFRLYDLVDGVRQLNATSYPVIDNNGVPGLYTVYSDGSEGQFKPFDGASSGITFGPVYSPNLHTVYISSSSSKYCHLFDDGTDKFAYSDRDLTTYYPAGTYNTADGDTIVVNADGTWDYAAPPEYVELEWISSGTYNDYLAIDTGVVACNQYRMVADVQWNAHNSQVQRFGAQWCTGPGTAGDYYTYAFGTTESGWSMNTGFASSGGKWEISSGRDTDRHVFDAMFYSPYTGKFDSTTHTFPNTGTAQPPSNVCTVHLFGRSRWAGTSIEIDNYCSCKLYSCQIYNQAGVLIRDFVPAKFSDDTVGLYDKVEGKQYLSWQTSSFEPGPEKSVTPVAFNYVNGSASATTLYLYNNKLYADAAMTTAATAGTYVNASYRYVVVSGGSFTYETYSTVTTTTPAATLYLTASKAYSNPGMTTYPTAGEYANDDWKYVVASDGSYIKEPVTPTDYIELQYVTVPYPSQGDFLYQYNGNNAGTYKIEFGYSPDSTAVIGSSAGFYLSSVGTPQGPGTNGGGYYRLWGPGWSGADSSVSSVVGTKHNFSFSFDRSTGAVLSIDGTTNSWGAGNFTFGNFGSFHIDGGSPSSSVAGECTLSGKWYAIKEYFDGSLVHDYVPAKSTDGTKVGFYDTLTDQWVLCSAGSAWSAGPEV